ncbi:MAG: tetratricopeptide repeat protein [Treponema sp.]|nr:tetratricopeptide repeat protein [Treponema sp.]
MKRSFYTLCAVTLTALCMGLCVSCGGATYNSVKRMQKMEEGVSNPTTVEELTEAIKKYDARALDLVTTQEQVGIWYKILGTRYLDQQMYGEAMECFQRAIETFPNNANLYYYLAVSAGYTAHTALDFTANGGAEAKLKQQRYLRLAESAYQRALTINPKYYRAMYGIGVLYVFELGESENAIPYMEEFLRNQTKDTNGMFLLAHAYCDVGELEKASEMYDRIISLNSNPDLTEDARRNKQAVLNALHGVQ